MDELLRTLLTILVIATVLGLVGLALLHRRLKRLRLAPGADFVTCLRVVPFSLVVVLDLLDLGLDFFSAPITWVFLSRYNLQGLRSFAVIESLIPFTQAIPTLTLSWIVVNTFKLGQAPLQQTGQGPYLEADEVEPGRYAPRTGR